MIFYDRNSLFFFASRLSPPNTIGKLVVSPLIKRSDSSSSNASSFIDDTVRSLAMTTTATTNVKQQLYNNGVDQRKITDPFLQ